MYVRLLVNLRLGHWVLIVTSPSIPPSIPSSSSSSSFLGGYSQYKCNTRVGPLGGDVVRFGPVSTVQCRLIHH